MRAQLVELKVTLLYLKTKCQSVREKDCVIEKQRIRAMQRESKTILDSGFCAVDSGFQVLDSKICQ